jgi:hypothetical protein
VRTCCTLGTVGAAWYSSTALQCAVPYLLYAPVHTGAGRQKTTAGSLAIPNQTNPSLRPLRRILRSWCYETANLAIFKACPCRHKPKGGPTHFHEADHPLPTLLGYAWTSSRPSSKMDGRSAFMLLHLPPNILVLWVVQIYISARLPPLVGTFGFEFQKHTIASFSADQPAPIPVPWH